MMNLIALGRCENPVLRYTATGDALFSLFVAVYESYGQSTEYTRFYATLTGEAAEKANEELVEGSPVLVRGVLRGDGNGQPRVFFRQADNSPYSAFEINAMKIMALPGQIALDSQDFGFSEISYIGRLGHDPELRYTPTGKSVCDLRIAIDVHSGQQKETFWLKTTLWGKQAENATQYLAKGRQVYVSARLKADTIKNEDGVYVSSGRPRIWIDKDGVAKASFEATANHIQYLGSKNESGNGGPPAASPLPVAGMSIDEIPF